MSYKRGVPSYKVTRRYTAVAVQMIHRKSRAFCWCTSRLLRSKIKRSVQLWGRPRACHLGPLGVSEPRVAWHGSGGSNPLAEPTVGRSNGTKCRRQRCQPSHPGSDTGCKLPRPPLHSRLLRRRKPAVVSDLAAISARSERDTIRSPEPFASSCNTRSVVAGVVLGYCRRRLSLTAVRS